MEEKKAGWLIGIIKDFAVQNEISHQMPQENQIALSVQSTYNNLTTVIEVNGDQTAYEHYTPTLIVPDHKRGEIALEAISEAYKDITPVLPQDDNRLFLYGNTIVQNKSEIEIKDGILDVMGRVTGYDNEKHPVFKHILSRK